VSISEANYSDVVDAYKNIDPLYLIKRNIEFVSQVTTTEELGSKKTETTIHNCEVSGSAIEINVEDKGETLSTYNTQNCITDTGIAVLNYESYDSRESYTFSGKTDSEKTLNLEYADSIGDIDNETLIDLEGVGQFLVRHDYWATHYFGADGTVLKTLDPTTQKTQTRPACYRQITSEYQLNDNEPFIEVLEELDDCLSNPDFSEFAAWSEVGSTLVYNLFVLNDNTPLEAVFFTPDEEAVLILEILDSEGKSIGYFSEYGYDLIMENRLLDTGVYTIYLEHDQSEELNNGVEFQLNIENAALKFKGEVALPSNLIASVSSEWVNGGGASSDITTPGNIVYQMDVKQDSIFTFQMKVSEWEYLYLINADGSLIKSEYGYNNNPAFIKRALQVGTYYIVAATEEEGETGTFDITVKSDNAGSASVTLYSN